MARNDDDIIQRARGYSNDDATGSLAESYGDGAFIGPDGQPWVKLDFAAMNSYVPEKTHKGNFKQQIADMQANATKMGNEYVMPISKVQELVKKNGIYAEGDPNFTKKAFMAAALAFGGGAALSGLGGLSGGAGLESLAGGIGTDTLGGAVAGGAGEFAGIPGLTEFSGGLQGSFLAPEFSGIPGLSEFVPGAGAFGGAAVGAPFQPGFNLLDPSTYGGSAAAGGTGAAAQAARTALGRILDGSATPEDYASVVGSLGATGLGVLGSNAQADALRDVSQQYLALGAPYRTLLEGSYKPGFDLWKQPAYKSALDDSWESAFRGMNSNPFDNPGQIIEANKRITGGLTLPALSNYRGQLGQFGGLGLNTSGQASLAEAGQSGNLYDALGFGLGSLTNPQTSLQDLLRQAGGSVSSNPYKLNLGELV